jgi:hypothetical protein
LHDGGDSRKACFSGNLQLHTQVNWVEVSLQN